MLQVITCWLSWGMDSNDSHNPFRGPVALNWNTSKYRSTWFGLFQTINAVLRPIRPVQDIRNDIQIKAMKRWNIQGCVFEDLYSLSTIVIYGGYGIVVGVNPIQTLVGVINCDTTWPYNVACYQRLSVASC